MNETNPEGGFKSEEEKAAAAAEMAQVAKKEQELIRVDIGEIARQNFYNAMKKAASLEDSSMNYWFKPELKCMEGKAPILPDDWQERPKVRKVSDFNEFRNEYYKARGGYSNERDRRIPDPEKSLKPIIKKMAPQGLEQTVGIGIIIQEINQKLARAQTDPQKDKNDWITTFYEHAQQRNYTDFDRDVRGPLLDTALCIDRTATQTAVTKESQLGRPIQTVASLSLSRNIPGVAILERETGKGAGEHDEYLGSWILAGEEQITEARRQFGFEEEKTKE